MPAALFDLRNNPDLVFRLMHGAPLGEGWAVDGAHATYTYSKRKHRTAKCVFDCSVEDPSVTYAYASDGLGECIGVTGKWVYYFD